MNLPGQTWGSGTLASLIDEERLSAYQFGIVGVCAVVAMLDGFDTQAIAFTAPAIAAALDLPVERFGGVFASGLLGGMLGGFGFGSFADRYGRKTALLATMLIFAVGTLLTIQSSSRDELLAYRLLTGLGLGGAMPSIISLTAEYVPKRVRASSITAMFCGFPLGAILGALASAPLLPRYGWTSVFLLGGILPLLLLPVVGFGLPESIQWLAARKQGVRLSRIMARMHRAQAWNGEFDYPAARVPRARVTSLFVPTLKAGTLLLWCALFLSLMIVYLLVNWLPTIAQQSGAGSNAATRVAAVLNLSGILGSVCLSRLIDRLGAFRVVSSAYAVGAVGVVALGIGTHASYSVYWFAAAAGFLCVGAQLCVVAIAANFYPLELRATGVGWAMGVGRLGAISGPLIGGVLMASTDRRLLFVLLASASLLAALAIVGLARVAK